MLYRLAQLLWLWFLCGSVSSANVQDTVTETVFTLRQCIDLAVKHNTDILKAGINQTVASADLQAAASKTLPRFSVSSQYSREGPAQQYVYSPVAGITLLPSGASNYYSTGISLSENIIALSDWASIGQTSYARKAIIQNSRQTGMSAAESVIEAYYNQVKLTKALDVAESSVRQNQEQTDLSRAMLAAGLLARADMLKAEVALMQSNSDRITAQNNLVSGAGSLALLIGVSGTVRVDTAIDAPDTVTPLPSHDSLVKEAFAANPAYRSAQLTLLSLRAAAVSSWLALLPTFAVTSSYSYVDSVQFSSAASWANNNSWSYGVQLNWNIFDGTLTESQIRRARAQERSAEVDLANIRRTTENNVRVALSSAIAARKNLSIVVPLLSSAAESYRLTKEKFKVGAASALDLLTSRVTFNQSEQQAANALCDYGIAVARLNLAVGKMPDIR